MSKALIFGGFVFSLCAGGLIGYAVNDHFADRERKAAADAALIAQAKATEDVRATEKASRDAVAANAAAFDAFRLELETQKPIIETKIREIYRNVPAPPIDCAAPDAARRLLIDAGAHGPAGRNASAAADAGR